MVIVSKHLTNEEKIKLGSFYTPSHIVDTLEMLLKNNNIKGTWVDTSCGYGSFLNKKNSIGYDLDKEAVDYSSRAGFNVKNINSLSDIDIINDNIPKGSIIVGNPPYNNWSSFYKKNNKGVFNGSDKYKSRDIGISFLRSYVDIDVDIVAVLHPLAFLVKKSNFNSLKEFKDNFIIVDSYVFSSREFPELKSKIPFPIVIAVYKRVKSGMNWEYINNFNFKISNGKSLKLSKFNYIEEFHTKYKDKNTKLKYNNFYTLRDINALFRNKTWTEEETSNSIRVLKKDEWVFNQLETLKEFYGKNINEYFFIGSLSPVILNKKITSYDEVARNIFEKTIRDTN